MAHRQKSPQLLSREELAKLVDRHPRRISQMAREDKIPGITTTQKGRCARYFPVLRSPRLDAWILRERAHVEKLNREGGKRGPKKGSPARDPGIDTMIAHVNRIVALFAKLKHKGTLPTFTAYQLHAMHRDLLPVLQRHAVVLSLLKKAKDRPAGMLEAATKDLAEALSRKAY